MFVTAKNTDTNTTKHLVIHAEQFTFKSLLILMLVVALWVGIYGIYETCIHFLFDNVTPIIQLWYYFILTIISLVTIYTFNISPTYF
jgi:fumarate reductase subunit D